MKRLPIIIFAFVALSISFIYPSFLSFTISYAGPLERGGSIPIYYRISPSFHTVYSTYLRGDKGFPFVYNHGFFSSPYSLGMLSIVNPTFNSFDRSPAINYLNFAMDLIIWLIVSVVVCNISLILRVFKSL